jgi:hypothetical protein
MVGIYFSGTGNSRYAVEFFCNEYDEAAKTFSIEDVNIILAIKNEDMIVFAYPVQYSTVPKILRDFGRIKKFLLSPQWDCLVVTEQVFSGDFYSNTEQK